LLAAIEQLAQCMGYKRIYCATATSSSLLARGGWQLTESIDHDGADVDLFEKTLANAP
jgi:hypothetical protein